MNIRVVTREDIQKENIERASKVTEDQKRDIIFNGEHLYYLGVGHAWLWGFFNEYITKSGIILWEYDDGIWSVDHEDFKLVNGEFEKIFYPETTQTPITEDFKFPQVKNVNPMTLADQIFSIQPREKPKE